MRRLLKLTMGWLVLLSLTSVVDAQSAAEFCDYKVVDQYPHDVKAFTQGLVTSGPRLFESTGLNGKSSVREVLLNNGNVFAIKKLPRHYFGEGLTLVDNQLVQLTWKSGTGFVYDMESLRETAQFRYDGEGWGLTFDGTSLILSDGSSTLRFYETGDLQSSTSGRPHDLRLHRTLSVTDGVKPINQLNELEFAHGSIWANVWQTPLIARIDPESGKVQSWLNLTQLATPFQRQGVANGIAWYSPGEVFLVTGKNWPVMFAIKPLCL